MSKGLRSTDTPIRVFIADDHAVLRRGLQALLESTGAMVVCGTASDGLEALNAASLPTADVILLDLDMPRLGGVELLRRLRQQGLTQPVIILSMYPETQHGLQLLREGASAYLSKQRPPEELIDAIHRVSHGGTYLTDTLAQGALTGSAAQKAPHQSFSPREHQVFLLLLQGRSASDIAAELDLHTSTVSNNLRRIKDKLGVNTVADIIHYAHRQGLAS